MEKCSLPLGNKARYKILFTKKDLKQDELLTFTYKTSNNFKIIMLIKTQKYERNLTINY